MTCPIFGICFQSLHKLHHQVITKKVPKLFKSWFKNKDYIYEVNGVNVFEMDHDQCTKLIKDAGDKIDLKIER